jgi:hypothetical protein
MPIIPQQGDIDPVSGLTSKPQSPASQGNLLSRELYEGIPQFDPNVAQIDVEKFRKYVPRGDVFVDEGLEDARAIGQSTGEQWLNGLTKFVGKTGTAVLGGTIGTIGGLPNLFREDRSVYDTGFQRWLDDMNERMDEVLPNYATSIEKEEGFLQSLNNANFWANDVLSGLSFTAGAVLTELVWSAASAATLGAAGAGQAAATAGLISRGARYLKNISKAEDVAKGLARMKKAGQIDAALRVGRQMYTGAGYEAGVEARQHKKQLTDQLRSEWLANNPGIGTIPNEDLARIDDYVTRSANGVFAANVAVVGLSNMIALPKIFGPGAKSMRTPFSAITKQFKEVEGAWKTVFTPAYKDASRLNKIIEASYLTAKNPFVEGVWEEGMQGVANNTMLDYTTKKYNPDGTDSVTDLLDSFGEGLQETYGGKEGWKEIGIGIIIGAIGSPNFNAYERKRGKLARKKGQPIWTGGIAGEFQSRDQKRREADRLVGQLNTNTTEGLIAFLKENPELLKSTKALIEHNIRSAPLNAEMDKAMEANSMFDVKNVENDQIHSFITSRIEGGFGADLIDEFTASVENMSDEEFATTFNYTDLNEQEITQRKQTVVQNFKERVDRTKEIIDLVDSNLKIDKTTDRGREIRNSLVYAGSVIRDAQKREDELAARIFDLTGVTYDPKERGETYQEDFRKEVNAALREDPTNKPEVKQLQSDIKKLQKRREGYITQYNRLFTKQGQEEYMKIVEETIKTVNEDIRKAAEEDAEQARQDTETGEPDGNTGRVLDEAQKQRLTKKINSFTDPEELTDFINNTIKPLELSNIDDVRKEAERVYRKLTGEKLNIKAPRYVDKVYHDKKTGKKYIVRRDSTKPDTYYLKEFKDKDNIKNVATLTKAQLDDGYIFDRAWEKHKNKEGRIGNLENMINSKQDILDTEKKEGKSFRKRLEELQKKHEELVAKLRKQKKDGRATKASIKETNDLLDETNEMINDLQAKIDKSVKAQVGLKVDLNYWYGRLEEEEGTADLVNLKERVDNIEQEMADNNEAIGAWQKTIRELKKLVNKLLNLFGQGRLYEELTKEQVLADYEAQLNAELMDFMTKGGPSDVVEIDGKKVRVPSFDWYDRQIKAQKEIKKKLTAKKAAITRAVNRGIEAQGEYPIAEAKIQAAENQIKAFEKANDELWEKLYLIEEEVKELREYRKKARRSVKGVEAKPIKQVNKTVDTDPIEEVHVSETSEATVPTEDKEESKQVWSGIKRHINNVFRGLTGRHVEASGELTADKDQRRYFRWTSKTDLASENYSIKIVKATEEDREKIERAGYKFEDAYHALVVDKDGKYVQEEGDATELFNRDVNIWTSFPLATLTTSSFGDKYYTPKTKEEWAKLYPSLTVKEAEKTFEEEKKRLVIQHNALREGISERLENGEEVLFKLVDKSVGIPNDTFDEKVHLAIDETLGHSDVQIVVSTLGVTSFDNKAYANLKPGFTYLQDKKTGNRFEARSRKLNDNEVNMVINMLRSFVNKSSLQESGKITSKDANQLTTADGTVVGNIFKVMSDLVFWTGNNLKKDSSGNYTLPLNTNEETAFFFVPSEFPGGSIRIGKEEYQLFVVEEGNLILNEAIADENGDGALKTFLEKRYVNVNANKVESKQDFLEFTSVDENGVSEFTVHKGEEGGYKSYLMGDGTGNHILGLSVAPAGSTTQVVDTDGKVIEEETPQVLSQYAIYEASEDYATEVSDTIQEGTPSAQYDNFENLRVGSRLRVRVQKLDGKTHSSGIVQIEEDHTLSVVQGEVGEATVSNMTKILNTGPQAKAAYDDTNRVFREKLEVEIQLADVVLPTKVEEKKKVEEPKVEPKKERRTGKRGADLNRTPTGDRRGKADLSKERAWFEKRFPEVDFNTVKNLIDGKHHGQFRNAAIYLYENAEVGTTYHEAFHVVTQLFLSRVERNDLYREYKRRVPEHSGYTNKQIEEILAEEFREFILTKEEYGTFDPIKYTAPIQLNFFQRLFDYIRRLMYGRPQSIYEIFENIEADAYGNQSPNLRFTQDVTLNRTPKNKDEAFGRAAMEGVNYFFFKKLFASDKSISTLFSKEDNSALVKELYDYSVDQIERRIGDLQDLADASSDRSEIAYYENVIDELWYMVDNWTQNENYTDPKDKTLYSMVGLHKRFLSQYRLEFITSEDVVRETDTNNDPDNQWANESIKISSKMNATKNIKLLLGTLAEVEDNFDLKMNILELPHNADFGYTFNILANRLTGTRTLGQMKARLSQLSEKHPYLTRLMDRLNMNENPESLSREEMLEQIQFVQVFAKAQNTYVFDITGENGHFKIVNSNVNSVNDRIRQGWKNDATQKNNTKENEDGILMYDRQAFKTLGVIDDMDKAFSFLDKIGVTFTTKDEIEYDKNFIKRAEAIRGQIMSKQGQVWIFDKEVSTNTKGDLDYFIDLERTSTVDYIENSHYNIEGNLVYDVVINSYVSLLTGDLANVNTLDEFLEENPHLRPENTRYIANSLLLKRGGILFDKNGNKRPDALTVEIHEGSKETNTDMSKEFEDLGEPDQLRVHINRGLEGAYPLLRPADNSIERYFNFGKPIFSTADIVKKEHISQMVDYLKDELFRSKDIVDNGTIWKNYDKNKETGILMSIVATDPFLSEEMKSLLENENYTVEEFFDNSDLMDKVELAIEKYFTEKTQDLIELAVSYGIIEELPDGDYYNNGLSVEGNPATLNKASLTTLIRGYVVNDTIFNIEQTKVIFADPIGFKSVEDQFKRHSGAVGTKKISAVYDEINQWIAIHLKRTDRSPLMKNGKPVVRTAVFADVIVKSQYYDEYTKILGFSKVEKFYGNMEEGDGQGYISIDEWREMLFRAGEWSFGVGSLEDLYQYEIQTERGVETPTDPVTGREIDKDRLPVANPLKPQYMGPLAEDEFVLGFYKTSLFPLLPSVTKNFDQLERLRVSMKNTGTGIAVFESGNKSGTKLNENAEVQQFYDSKTGQYGYPNDDFVTQDTYYKYWGIQQEAGSSVKKKVVSGTQMAKQIINGIFENGEAKNEQLGLLAKEYMQLNGERIAIGLGQLIETLGLEQKGEKYQVKSVESLIARFKREAIERELPDNIVDAIDNLRIGNGIDTLINREKVENILLAIADSMSTSQKRSGSPKVQVSNAIGKTVRVVVDDTGRVWDSSDLAFYHSKDGKITQMEVYLPNYLKGHVTDSRLKDLIGFRIPTQGLNSIESIKIKGFLPAEAGDSIIVPSEMVAKSGSDFDIDKLNIYYPNVYYNRKGNPEYIELKEDAELKKDYNQYSEAFKLRFINRLISKDLSELIKTDVVKLVREELNAMFRTENFTIDDIIDGLDARINEFQSRAETGTTKQKFAYENAKVIYENVHTILQNAVAEIQENPTSEFEPMSFSEFKKRAIENRISEIQKEIILHPANFKQLINPISADALAEEAKEIRKLRGQPEKEVATMHNMVEREYLMGVARRFIGGKQAVGITAIHSTFDILAKIADVSIAEEIKVWRNRKLQTVPTKINLSHNEKEGLISLSKQLDADDVGNIAETLSQWINAAVDAAKDPFMFDLNSGPETLNVVLYLTMAGVPMGQLARFMTQPIIIDYLQNRQKWESQMMEGNVDPNSEEEASKKKYRNEIVTLTQSPYKDGGGIDNPNNYKDNFSISELESNIKQGARGSMSKSFATDQLQILSDFLRYVDTARKLGDAIKGVDYDTNAAGKNTSELLYKLENTDVIASKGNVENYNKILEEDFIAPYYNAVKDLRNILNPFFISLNDENVLRQFNKLFEVLFNDRNNLPTDKKIRVVDKFKQSFLTYLLVTRPYKRDGKVVMNDDTVLPMNTQIERLFKGKNSIAHRLEEMQEKYPNMQLLSFLESNISIADASHHVIVRSKKVDTVDSNQLTNEWTELFEQEESFANDLVLATILQYGISNNPFSFTNLIPFKVYGEIVNSILDNEASLDKEEKNKMYDEWYDQFFLNNYDDDSIVPKHSHPVAKIYPFSKKAIKKKEYRGKSNKELTEIKAKGINIWNPVPSIIRILTGERITSGLAVKDFRNKRNLLAYGEGKTVVDKTMPNQAVEQNPFQLSNEAKEAADKAINEKIRNWMNKVGITYQNVEEITNREGQVINAIAKADMFHKVVQVVEGKADITTLSEEAAHFLVELLGDENPVLKMMMNMIDEYAVYDEVVAEYGEMYNNDDTMLRKEAVGKMIAKTVVRQEKIGRMSRFQKAFESAWRWIKRHILGKVSSAFIEEELSPFLEAADIMLTGNVEGLKPLESIEAEEPFYQVEVTEEEKKQAEEIINKFGENRVQRDLEHAGYKTPEGKKTNRVTDFVKDFYKKKFKRAQTQEQEEFNEHLANKGTIVHKYLELIGESVFEGKPINWKDAEKEVIRQLTDRNDIANEPFWNKERSYFALKNVNQFSELLRGVQSLKDQVLAKQKKIDPNGTVKFFPELIVYDQFSNVAGTIDLAVVYSNGVVGIYDYKGIRYNSTQTIPRYKEEAYNIQISEYKKVLSRAYGVENFGETRIVPIDMSIGKVTKTFEGLLMGAYGLNDKERPHLHQLPVSREMTDDKDLNITLTKMLDLYDTLSQQLEQDYKNEKLRVRVSRLRESIKSIQLKGDVSFIFGEINALYKDFQDREHLPQENPYYLSDEAIREFQQYIGVYEHFGINAMETAKKNNEEGVIKDLERVSHMLELLNKRLVEKSRENLNKGEDFDVTAPAKAENMMGRTFKQLSKFNRNAFKKLSNMVRQVSDEVRREVNVVVEDVSEKTESLKDWAKNRGDTLQQAFDRIINSKTGNLVSQWSPKYYEEKEKAIEDKNLSWFLNNANVERVNEQLFYTGNELTKFNEAKQKHFEYIDRTNQGDNKEAEDKRRFLKKQWSIKFDITQHPDALYDKYNWYVRPADKAENYSDEYNFMLKPENKALLDYYEMYVNYNRDFAERTGKDIKSNFVAEIHKDVIDRLGDVGLSGVFGIKDNIARALEIREFDSAKGTVDPATGKPIHAIPLFYTDKLTGRLTKKEKKDIRDELKETLVEGTTEFEEAYERKVKSREFTKGTKSKSRDLSRSLIIFAEAAYSHQHLSESESTALALRDILKAQGQQTELVDAAGKKVQNKYTRGIAKMLGVPAGEIEAMDKFINLYWYGRTTQGADITFGDGKYSGTKAYQMIMKFTSATALGLKPILAAGNTLGIKSNFYMTGWEGRYYNKKDINAAHRMLLNRDKKYAASIAYFEPFTHDLTFRKANNLSVSKLVKGFTFENVFILHRKGDEMIDRNITVSMMHRFGIEEDGKVTRLDKIKGEDKRSLIERAVIKDDKMSIEGLSEKQFVRFRAMIQRAAVGIKGNIPQEDRNLIGTSLAGQALMQFRNWMPGLIEKRFKAMDYDHLFEEHDVGRFRVFAGEFTAKGVMPKLKAFTKLIGEVAMMNIYDKKGVNMEVTQKFYDKYIMENPESTLTIEEFVELRKSKLKGMAKELQIYLGFMMMVFAGKAMLPEDEDSVANRALKLIAQNSYRMTQRGLLEISFFFDPSSVMTILKSPIPSIRIFNDLRKMLVNTFDETRDVIFGEDVVQDKTPKLYYFGKIVPISSSAVDFFDIFDTYNKDRGF